ncbi:hypothetical protein HDV00_011055 [Rhizophlyctis rosea]|nr:hypothetical protein HDV00_011055 [Rhizophlyctis rosea]
MSNEVKEASRNDDEERAAANNSSPTAASRSPSASSSALRRSPTTESSTGSRNPSHIIRSLDLSFLHTQLQRLPSFDVPIDELIEEYRRFLILKAHHRDTDGVIFAAPPLLATAWGLHIFNMQQYRSMCESIGMNIDTCPDGGSLAITRAAYEKYFGERPVGAAWGAGAYPSASPPASKRVDQLPVDPRSRDRHFEEACTFKEEDGHQIEEGETSVTRKRVAAAVESNDQLAVKKAKTGAEALAAEEVDYGEFDRVFVGNLPKTVTEDQLKRLFADAGNVTKVITITNPRDGEVLNYRFVVFSSCKAAKKALRWDNYSFKGRFIRVEPPTPRPGSTRIVYIGNLSRQSSDTSIRAVFRPYGQIADVHLPTDCNTGRWERIGFVKFQHVFAAERAHDALNGTVLDGSLIHLGFSRNGWDNHDLEGHGISLQEVDDKKSGRREWSEGGTQDRQRRGGGKEDRRGSSDRASRKHRSGR